MVLDWISSQLIASSLHSPLDPGGGKKPWRPPCLKLPQSCDTADSRYLNHSNMPRLPIQLSRTLSSSLKYSSSTLALRIKIFETVVNARSGWRYNFYRIGRLQVRKAAIKIKFMLKLRQIEVEKAEARFNMQPFYYIPQNGSHQLPRCDDPLKSKLFDLGWIEFFVVLISGWLWDYGSATFEPLCWFCVFMEIKGYVNVNQKNYLFQWVLAAAQHFLLLHSSTWHALTLTVSSFQCWAQWEHTFWFEILGIDIF